jgi:hypothetical protein
VVGETSGDEGTGFSFYIITFLTICSPWQFACLDGLPAPILNRERVSNERRSREEGREGEWEWDVIAV